MGLSGFFPRKNSALVLVRELPDGLSVVLGLEVGLGQGRARTYPSSLPLIAPLKSSVPKKRSQDESQCTGWLQLRPISFSPPTEKFSGFTVDWNNLCLDSAANLYFKGMHSPPLRSWTLGALPFPRGHHLGKGKGGREEGRRNLGNYPFKEAVAKNALFHPGRGNVCFYRLCLAFISVCLICSVGRPMSVISLTPIPVFSLYFAGFPSLVRELSLYFEIISDKYISLLVTGTFPASSTPV